MMATIPIKEKNQNPSLQINFQELILLDGTVISPVQSSVVLDMNPEEIGRNALPTIWDSGLLSADQISSASFQLHPQTLWDWWLSLCWTNSSGFCPWFPGDPQHRFSLIRSDYYHQLFVIDERPGQESITLFQFHTPGAILWAQKNPDEDDERKIKLNEAALQRRSSKLRWLEPGESYVFDLSSLQPKTRQGVIYAIHRIWEHQLSPGVFRTHNESQLDINWDLKAPIFNQLEPLSFLPEGVHIRVRCSSDFPFLRAVLLHETHTELRLTWTHDSFFRKTPEDTTTFTLIVPGPDASAGVKKKLEHHMDHPLLFLASACLYQQAFGETSSSSNRPKALTFGKTFPRSLMIHADTLEGLDLWLDEALRQLCPSVSLFVRLYSVERKTELTRRLCARFDRVLDDQDSYQTKNDQTVVVVDHDIRLSSNLLKQLYSSSPFALIIWLMNGNFFSWRFMTDPSSRTCLKNLFHQIDSIVISHHSGTQLWPYPADFCSQVGLEILAPSSVIELVSSSGHLLSRKESALHCSKSSSHFDLLNDCSLPTSSSSTSLFPRQ